MPSMDGSVTSASGGVPASTAISQLPVVGEPTTSGKSRLVDAGNGSTPTDRNHNLLPFADRCLNDSHPMMRRVSSADAPVSPTGTGHSVAACGGSPTRKLSLGDLHIRSRQDDPMSACREIRDILRQIRDSNRSSADCTSGPVSSNHVDVGSTSEDLSSSRLEVTLPLQPIQKNRVGTEEVGCWRRGVGDPGRHGWRHTRFSLPPRLRPGHVDGLGATDDDGDCVGGCYRSGRRHRGPTASVRFADEMGMNLNTFAMIPSRQTRDDSPTCVPLPPRPAAAERHPCRVHAAFTTANHRPRSPSPPGTSLEVWTNGFDHLVVSTSVTLAAEQDVDEDDVESTDEGHEEFRLCFRQPFAELERFRKRLDHQLVCLENVRVDDWAAGAAHHHQPAPASNLLSGSSAQPASMAANSVILCSIQVKKSVRRGHRVDSGDCRVFARCTSDNWRSFADLPAQRVTGLDSMGLGYDRYCFAVRRPAGGGGAAADGSLPRLGWVPEDEPSAAVEFAVCYEAAGAIFWDNNDDVNYRIEWFQGPASNVPT